MATVKIMQHKQSCCASFLLSCILVSKCPSLAPFACLFNSKQSSGLKDLYLKPPSLSLFSVLYFLCASFVSTAMNQIQPGLLAYIGHTEVQNAALSF